MFIGNQGNSVSESSNLSVDITFNSTLYVPSVEAILTVKPFYKQGPATDKLVKILVNS